MLAMTELPAGWTSTSSRNLRDGSVVVRAERLRPVDLGPRKRNLFDQYTTFRVGPMAWSPAPSAGIVRLPRTTSRTFRGERNRRRL